MPSPGDFNTQLSPEDESAFQAWKQQYAPRDSGADYDLRGAFKAGLTPDSATGHWPDLYKKPNHPTFSDQSIYAKDRPELAGRWNGDQFVPPSRANQDIQLPASVTTSQQQQYDADIAAGRRPAFPPGQRFNSRGEAIARTLQPALPGAIFPAGPSPANGLAPPPAPAPASNALGVSAGSYSPSEAASLVGHFESEGLARRMGISPYAIGVGGRDLSTARLDENGFPIWEGHGNSHAAGRYQFQPSTWRQYAKPLGVTDFSQASQDAVFRAAYLDRGFGHWAPYNSALASHIGQPIPEGWGQQQGNQLAPAAAEAKPSDDDWIPPASPAAASPWSRLLALSALAQGAQVKPVQVKYDPRLGAQPVAVQEPSQLMEPGLSSLGRLGGMRIPRTAEASSAQATPLGDSSVGASSIPAGRGLPGSPTSYVTRLGMRPYYTDGSS